MTHLPEEPKRSNATECLPGRRERDSPASPGPTPHTAALRTPVLPRVRRARPRPPVALVSACLRETKICLHTKAGTLPGTAALPVAAQSRDASVPTAGPAARGGLPCDEREQGRARPTPQLAGPQGQALRKRAYVKGQVAGPPFCDTIQLTRDVGMAGVGGGLHGDGSVLHLNRGAGHRTRRCRGMTQSYVHITMSASWSGYGPVVPEEISQGGNWGEGTSGCCLYNFL